MTDERWTIRGIPADLQRAAADAAKAQGRTLGRWVADAINAALAGGQPADERQTGDAARLVHLEGQICDLAGRLASVEVALLTVRTDGGQSADTPVKMQSAPTTGSDAAKADTVAAGGLGAVADDTTATAPSPRQRLTGAAKAVRAADIRRRLDAGERKADIATALGISLPTLNRDLAG